jgi:lipoprotein-anchoring transpeptidase ErfK/SrfK
MLKQSGHLALQVISGAMISVWVWAGGSYTAAAREHVAFEGRYQPGTVVVVTRERRLYLVTAPGEAIRYPVGVGRAGKQWHGTSRIDGKYIKPAWAPPPEVKRDNPKMPRVIAGGAANNPMGIAALTLSGDQYAIHGTTQAMRKSVGTFASYGCIRMLNEDVMDLYRRVRVGTPVIVLP